MKDLLYLDSRTFWNLRKIGFSVFLILQCSFLYAGQIPEPPVIRDKDVRMYLRTLYNEHNNLEIVSTNPNGNRRGRRGDMVLYIGATQSVISVCTSSPTGTSWRAIPDGIVP